MLKFRVGIRQCATIIEQPGRRRAYEVARARPHMAMLPIVA
jgi:hypothetical protein